MKEVTYLQAVAEALQEELQRDGDVFLMGEDIGLYGGCFGVTKGLWERFGPERVRETPISEATFTGAAVAAAMMGMRPVVEIMFSDFISLSVDQLANHAAKYRFMTGGQVKVPMVLRTPAGAGTGAAAQHSQSLEAWFAHVPGLKVVMPATPYDVKGLLKASIRDDNPVVFFEHKLLYKVKGQIPEEDYLVPLGAADLKREGTDVTVITYSLMVHKALAAAEALDKEGISVEVLDLRTLQPLDDEAIIRSAKKTGRVVIVHEAVQSGGVGAEVAARICDSEAFAYLDAPIKRVASLPMPIPYTPTLEAQVVPREQDIISAIHDVLR